MATLMVFPLSRGPSLIIQERVSHYFCFLGGGQMPTREKAPGSEAMPCCGQHYAEGDIIYMGTIMEGDMTNVTLREQCHPRPQVESDITHEG